MRSVSAAIVVSLMACTGTEGAMGEMGEMGAMGAPGEGVQVRAEPAGANCANGGVAFVSATGTAYVCNGTDGADGTNGTNGANGTNGTNGVDATAPAGTIIAFAGSSAPTGYLLCDGSAVSRTTYAALFAQIGVTYGVGDSVTTFNLPDARGVFLRGEGTQTIGGNAFTGTKGITQGDLFRSHNHGGGNHNHSTPTIDIGGGAYNGNGSYLGRPNGNNQNGTVAASGTIIATEGGAETRPANIVVTYYIKS